MPSPMLVDERKESGMMGEEFERLRAIYFFWMDLSLSRSRDARSGQWVLVPNVKCITRGCCLAFVATMM